MWKMMLLLFGLLVACSNGSDAVPAATSTAQPSSSSTAAGGVSFSKGLGTVTTPRLLDCPGGRVSAIGEVTSEDGVKWVVPAKIATGMTSAGDLSNPCTRIENRSLTDVNLDNVPVVEIDPDGVVITGYIYADNYFELYVGGKPVAKDPVPYTPFNASIVRFKAKYPMTYAIHGVDWEENLGQGTEDNKGSKFAPGDAGIVAVFSDGTATDASWKAQTFYIAPLTSKDSLRLEEKDGKEQRLSPQTSSPPACGTDCYAAHFAVPDGWYAASFDDSRWPNAVTYSEQTVGVDNKKEYTNYRSAFGKGSFIWTSNLVLDNEVLLRRTVEKAPK
ncbi:hypothetical protein [Paenibacillus cymbidii]|uniref:hypothetical protein n=1 Tax=Paenibacillus cymbidii TaxID=1639034 RepID=UPI0010822801|nr:hypothetical protein [Paenibacillus cymbidii]